MVYFGEHNQPMLSQIHNNIIQNDQALDVLKEERTTPEIYYTALKYFARFTQFLTWPFAFLIFHSFFDLKINGKENLKTFSAPYIAISNHIAFYDSFLFILIFGTSFSKIPFRFMGVKKFRSLFLNTLSALWIIDIVYALFGVFVIEKGRGIEKNLEEAVRIIRNGGNVFIYPEGSIIKGGQIEQFKLGASVLAKKTKAPVVPVSMRISQIDRFSRRLTVNIGEVIDVDTNQSSEEITKRFRDVILNLHQKK